MVLPHLRVSSSGISSALPALRDRAHRDAGPSLQVLPTQRLLRAGVAVSAAQEGFVVGDRALGYNDAEVLSMRVQSGQIAVGLAALLLGLMVAVQFRLQEVVPQPSNTDQLLALLKQADQKGTQLSQQVAHLHMQLNQRLSREASARRLKQELSQDEILAGTVPVKGPGVTVVWSNSGAPAAYQITDIDLLLLVNELRAAGAEAISINGQRITAQTEIRSASNYILINQAQTQSPFTVKAIGQPSALSGALTLAGGLYDESKQEGLSMTITKEKTVDIPAAPPAILSNISPKETP